MSASPMSNSTPERINDFETFPLHLRQRAFVFRLTAETDTQHGTARQNITGIDTRRGPWPRDNFRRRPLETA